MISFAIKTIGCKVNQAESAGLTAMLERHGLRRTNPKNADVLVLNTCTVTHRADRDARKTIRRWQSTCRAKLICAIGCLPQRDPHFLGDQTSGLLLLGNAQKHELAQRIIEALTGPENRPLSAIDPVAGRQFQRLPPGIPRDHTRAWLKIQDGCDSFCAYCIVPHVRGAPRSLPVENVIKDIRSLVARQTPEIVLTGIHIGRYGQDLNPKLDLNVLLTRLTPALGDARLRLSSLDPGEITEELLETVAANRRHVCDHFHISMQSGDDETLERMGRRYDGESILDTARTIHGRLPHAGISLDLIVGFPGETEAAFERTATLLAGLPFHHVHVFTYSPRPGTRSAGWPDDVPHAEKSRRATWIRQLAREKRRRFATAQLERSLDAVVLSQNPGDTHARCLTSNYLDLNLQHWSPDRHPRRLLIRLTGQSDTGLTAAVPAGG